MTIIYKGLDMGDKLFHGPKLLKGQKMITIRRLEQHDRESFYEAYQQFPEEPGFRFVELRQGIRLDDFDAILQMYQDNEKGINLPPNYVAATTFFGFNETGKIVGRISVRHKLTPFLKEIGGHIGYGVLPQHRGQGYASEMLKLCLPFCRDELGLSSVLLTCDDDNIASIRTIEKNGGVYQDSVRKPGMLVAKRRYWISL